VTQCTPKDVISTKHVLFSVMQQAVRPLSHRVVHVHYHDLSFIVRSRKYDHKMQTKDSSYSSKTKDTNKIIVCNS